MDNIVGLETEKFYKTSTNTGKHQNKSRIQEYDK